MRSLRAVALAGSALALTLIAAPAASATTEVGTDCAADAEAPAHTLVPLAKQPSSRPLTVPSAGVVTSWRIDLAPPLTSAPAQVLKVMRTTGEANSFAVVAESAPMPLTAAGNAFSARFPVQAGDRFGVSGGEAGNVMFCSNRPGESVGSVGSDLRAGSSATFTVGDEVQVPVVATVEPDQDGDGYGDETQDGCPQSAAYQGPCPRVEIGATAVAGKKAVTLLITAGAATTVSVTASVAHHHSLLMGITRRENYRTPVLASVEPGQLTTIRLFFYRHLRLALKKLEPEKHLTLKVSLSAPNLTGLPTVKELRVRLKGQAEAQKPNRSIPNRSRPAGTLHG
jgi:hypothetical protein